MICLTLTNQDRIAVNTSSKSNEANTKIGWSVSGRVVVTTRKVLAERVKTLPTSKPYLKVVATAMGLD
jgi:hypothetical protein